MCFDKLMNGLKMKKNRLPIRISIAVGIWLIFMTVFCVMVDIKPTVFYPLQDNMSSDVYYADGTTAHFEDGDFGNVRIGDRVEMHVSFPQRYGIKAAELYVPIHNVVLNVELKGVGDLYRDNVDMTDLTKHYGNRIYEVQLPGGFEVHELVIEMLPTTGRVPFSDLAGIGIIPANEGWKQIISGHILVFLFSISLMVMAMICISYFTVKSIEEKKLQLGLSIAAFEFMISGWFFASLGMFHLIVGNTSVSAKAEYYTLYFAPIPLAVFIWQVIEKKLMKRIVAAAGFLYLGFYVVATVVELLPRMLNYSQMLPGMHALAGIIVVCSLIAIFRGIEGDENSYILILRFGIVVAMICGLVELLRFNLVKYVLDDTWFSTKGLSGLAIIVVAFSLVVYLISYSTNEFVLRVERQQLMKLAYQDALTGMPNRADCYRCIEEMEKKKIREYTMLFIDLNNLKLANDKWGHDMGDRLLQVTADAIVESFAAGGFVSRWGGDEFVACVFGKTEQAMEMMEKFEKRMNHQNETGEFPFEVSAACGWVHSEDGKYLAPIEAIRLSDEEMYEKKRKMKQENKR